MKRPNILFLIADDHRFDALGVMGDSQVITPNLDRLAKEGTLFTHAHLPSGNTAALCSPSRAMLHTGRTFFHIGGTGDPIPGSFSLLGETLRGGGYCTFGAGKWHNGRDSFHRSFSAGAEIFFGGMTDHWNMPAYHFDPSGAYDTRLPRCVDAWTSKKLAWIQADHLQPGKHSTDCIADAAIEFIQHHDPSEPFFAYVAFLSPHDPRTMPRHYRDLYDEDALELPPNFMPEEPVPTGTIDIRDEKLAPYPRTPKSIKEHLADYYAMITHMDDRIGDIRRALEEQGEWENTIVVYTADHGLAVGRHGLMGKQNLYDHSVRIPLIMRGPGIPSSQQRDQPCYLMDMFPTLCDLTDTAVPDSVESRSLLPILRNAQTPGRNPLFFAYCDLLRGLRANQWKWIDYRTPGNPPEHQLFNLEEDPHELHDRSRDPACADIVREMSEALRMTAAEWDDPESPWGSAFWARPGAETPAQKQRVLKDHLNRSETPYAPPPD
ncbi:MAG: sulfatase-like hydrolase/transferase [Verrucomicrobia bacterium]|nr:sulfatase-like hydrolase/transferase [Verrucomicrobiota bacterium]MCH8527473.1 sulfatase-like hydrolase/transferase [Kiritimatiellia bacterium]